MIVLTLTDCPARLRGDLTKWLVEINTGVYVGNVSARVRDELWDRVCEHVKEGRATLVYTARNEQGMAFRVHNTKWEPVDFDGITLMRRPAQTAMAEKPDGAPLPARVEQRMLAQRNASRRAWIMEDYVVIDLETTGLSAAHDDIIELAALRIRKGQKAAAFERLVRIDKRLPASITELTGITDGLLTEQGVLLNTALTEFIAFLGNDVIIAHNAPFDISFLRAACKSEAMNMPRSRVIDTLDIARKRLKGLSDYKLSTVAAALGLHADGLHRAISDCELLHCVYAKLNENV